uniref:TctD-like protein n=1 Tax=Titanophycus setchellii TaxID=940129 RepID=A0A1G4NYG3_9FLOR|nr:Hypothetical protein ycf29 [Titanophycus setchellii]SCW23685.1 Hypothetical protein ycf29 [Titanophycus setchellii]
MLKRVLLVDDDAILLFSLSSYLSDVGFTIDTASSVDDAIHFLIGSDYDLVVSDIVMPYRNGYSLIEYMHSHVSLKNIPVIFLTAKGMTRDRIAGYDLGCAGYLVKPFDPAELLSMLRNILMNRNNFTNSINQLSSDYTTSALTSREQDVLSQVLKGMTNKEIAYNLGLTVRNIEKYVSRLLSKTGKRNRTELVQYFYSKRYMNEKT